MDNVVAAAPSAPAPVARREPALPKVAATVPSDEDEDDALSYFARLAEED